MELKQAWSYSALTSYETCPRRFQLTRVTKQVVEPQTTATLWGNKVHKALEDFANGKKPLPEDMQEYGKYVRKIQSYEGKRIVEERVALDSKLRPTTWMAKDVWVRGIIDIGVSRFRARLCTRLEDWQTQARLRPIKTFCCINFCFIPLDRDCRNRFYLVKGRKV